jgi:hypothetical protein
MSMVNMAKYSVKLDNNYYFNTILALLDIYHSLLITTPSHPSITISTHVVYLSNPLKYLLLVTRLIAVVILGFWEMSKNTQKSD